MVSLYTYNHKLLIKNNALAISSGCCCNNCKICLPQFIDGGSPGNDQHPGKCNAKPFFETSLCLPDECPLPATVTITGWVDDVVIINGEIIEENLYVRGPDDYYCSVGGYCNCDSAHCVGTGELDIPGAGPGGGCPGPGYSFEIQERCFTLAIGDNHGQVVEANLDICFNGGSRPYNCGTGGCTPVRDGTGGQFATLTECESQCMQRYECDPYSGNCNSTGFATEGLSQEECTAICVPQSYRCDYYDGCVPVYDTSGQFATLTECNNQCMQRYECDYYQGCYGIGFGTQGLASCDNCVPVSANCYPQYNYYCEILYGPGGNINSCEECVEGVFP